MEQIKALTAALQKNYVGYPVYTEKVKAVDRKPCFLVRQTGSSLKKEINGLYYLIEIFEISYFDKEKNLKNCTQINEELDYYLKNVDGAWGKKRSFKIKDGVLSVEYEYSARVRLQQPEPPTKMQGIKLGLEMIFNG